MVIEEIKVWPIVLMGEPLLCDGHADTGGDPMPESGPVVVSTPETQWQFWVSWSLHIELAKMPDIGERNRRVSQSLLRLVHRLISREMEHGPKQHGKACTVREHKAIAVGPDRIFGIEVHRGSQNRVDHARRECHRRCQG